MTSQRRAEDAVRNALIREWAASRRIPCSERGPIPPLVRQAYELAHPPKITPKATPGTAGLEPLPVPGQDDA